jgi:hypothetical protein
MAATRLKLLLYTGSALCAGLAFFLSIGSARGWTGDYSPALLDYPRIGSGGAWVQNQGTVLDDADAATSWNLSTQNNKLSVGIADCGTAVACFIYARDSDLDTGVHFLTYTNCPIANVPPFPDEAASWAVVFYINNNTTNMWNPQTHADQYNACRQLSPQGGKPIMVVAYNDELTHLTGENILLGMRWGMVFALDTTRMYHHHPVRHLHGLSAGRLSSSNSGFSFP